MKKFKGFTLAEILIVLTIIGVMAVMTIPSLIQNSNSQQKIAQFKKAFNAVSNAYATEFALKSPPKSWNDSGTSIGGRKIFDALTKQLNVKFFETYGKKQFEKPTGEYEPWEYWIETEDGMRYNVGRSNTSTDCTTKLTLNNSKSTDKAKSVSCIFIIVDYNGAKKPNKYCEDNEDLNNITCDLIRFFVTKDGITAGNPDCTIAGRIMSDNIEYDGTKCSEN